MIAVIGGVKATVRIKMAPPERDIEKQRKQDEDALLAAGIDISNMSQNAGETIDNDSVDAEGEDPLDARFREYYQQKLRQQENENYWDQVGLGTRDFGGYAPVTEGEDAVIAAILSGCSFNVAKILGPLTEVAFISIVGDDALGLAAKCELENAGVDISRVKTASGATPIGVEIVNMLGDLDFSRENMKLTQELNADIINEATDIFEKSDAIFIDGSVPIETMNFISEKYSADHPIYFDPASIQGGINFSQSDLKAVCVMPGRVEAEAMSGQQVLGLDQLMAAGEAFGSRGIDRTVITLKGGGAYYKEGSGSGIIKPETRYDVSETTGAGDVLSAQLMLELVNGTDLKAATESAVAAAVEFIAR